MQELKAPSNESIKKHFLNDKFATSIGVEILEVRPGYAKAKMKIQNRHYNSIDTVQGGAIFTLADYAFAVASNSHGNVAVAINTSISFVKAAAKGTLYAEATEDSLNPKIATYTVKITDDDGDLVAIFQGMAYRKKNRIEEFFKK